MHVIRTDALILEPQTAAHAKEMFKVLCVLTSAFWGRGPATAYA